MKINRKILKWSVQQWPLRTRATRKAKLIEELKELIQALENNDEVNTAEELFDAYAMIVDYADANKVKLKNIFRAKKIIIFILFLISKLLIFLLLKQLSSKRSFSSFFSCSCCSALSS